MLNHEMASERFPRPPRPISRVHSSLLQMRLCPVGRKPRKTAPNPIRSNDNDYCNIRYLCDGWGAWIRTREWRNQNPLPYHLATPQCSLGSPPGSPEPAATSAGRTIATHP